MSAKKIFLDEDGYQELLDYIDTLVKKLNNVGKELAQSNEDYSESWHDNPAYDHAMSKEAVVATKINHYNNLIKEVEIIKKTNFKDKINLDDKVELKLTFKDGSSNIDKYRLIGGYFSKEEGDFFAISINSPLGEAIHKQKIGKTVKYVLDNDDVVTAEILRKL